MMKNAFHRVNLLWWAIFFLGYTLIFYVGHLLDLPFVTNYLFFEFGKETFEMPLWENNPTKDILIIIIGGAALSLLLTLPIFFQRAKRLIVILLIGAGLIILGFELRRVLDLGEMAPLVFLWFEIPLFFLYIALIFVPLYFQKKIVLHGERKIKFFVGIFSLEIIITIVSLFLLLITLSIGGNLPKFRIVTDDAEGVTKGFVKERVLIEPSQEQLQNCKSLKTYLPFARIWREYHRIHCPLPILLPPGQTNEEQQFPTISEEELLRTANECKVQTVFVPSTGWGGVCLRDKRGYFIDSYDLAIKVIEMERSKCELNGYSSISENHIGEFGMFEAMNEWCIKP